jgi:hypothetical protein
MENKVIFDVYPEAYRGTPQYAELAKELRNAGLEKNELAIVPRGGDIVITPALAVAIAFIGTAYANGFIGAIANDHYNAVKKVLKKAFKHTPPRAKDWPSHLQTPPVIALTMQLKTDDHSYIIDFHLESQNSLNKSLEELPKFIASLDTNMHSSQYLIRWDGSVWTLTAVSSNASTYLEEELMKQSDK